MDKDIEMLKESLEYLKTVNRTLKNSINHFRKQVERANSDRYRDEREKSLNEFLQLLAENDTQIKTAKHRLEQLKHVSSIA